MPFEPTDPPELSTDPRELSTDPPELFTDPPELFTDPLELCTDPPELIVDVVRVDAAAVRVVVTGDVDAGTAEQLRRFLVEAVDRYRPRSVLVDCAGVAFLDAAGITSLVLARRHAARHRAEVRLVGTSRLVTRVLTLAGLAETFGLTQAT